MDCVSVILSASVPLVIVGGLWNRISADKGIGWQFIRFNVIAISLPIIALLAWNSLVTGEVATLIAGAMGYAFGKSGESD